MTVLLSDNCPEALEEGGSMDDNDDDAGCISRARIPFSEPAEISAQRHGYMRDGWPKKFMDHVAACPEWCAVNRSCCPKSS